LIKILNQNREPVAILENAYDIGYEKGFNQLWLSSFSLPLDDEKNNLCKPLYYVEVYDNGEYVGLFRIIPKETTIDEGGNTVSYQCEHVLATLLDSSIFKYRQIDGLPTNESIDYVLGFQKQAHWTLGICEIQRFFSYKFENSNVLSALFSIPQPFDQASNGLSIHRFTLGC
jgi:phage minor structural protein